MQYRMTKGTLSLIRNDKAGVEELQANGFALEGACDQDGNLLPGAVVFPDDDDDDKGGKDMSPEKKALVEAALAAGVVDPKTEKPATEAALARWGDKKLVEATEAAVKAKG